MIYKKSLFNIGVQQISNIYSETYVVIGEEYQRGERDYLLL